MILQSKIKVLIRMLHLN